MLAILGAFNPTIDNVHWEEDSPILKVKDKEKLILSPHIAWASVEARGRLFEEVLSNIEAFYNGEERNRVEK